MSEEKLRKYIIEMVNRISGKENLERVYDMVHRIFIRKGVVK